MLPPLVNATDLEDFPGAPFSADLVEVAADAVRVDAGWHIAPSVTSTVQVDGTGNATLLVPSLYLTGVASVTDLSTGSELDGFTWSESGVLHRDSGWPRGFRNIKVEMTHGYDACPPALFSSIASRVQALKMNRSYGDVRLGSLSISQPSYSLMVGGPSDAVSRFRLPPRS